MEWISGPDKRDAPEYRLEALKFQSQGRSVHIIKILDS
jgi:hypothetical protein